MSSSPLQADCARCAALCCVAFAFDRSESFAADKAANVPCANLDGGHRCRIHARLATSGFGGCVAFDCHGAGQVVTQEMFGGRSWRDDPALLPAMGEAFRILRRVHELRLLLAEAATLPLAGDDREAIVGFTHVLEPAGGWTPAALVALPIDAVVSDIHAFLRGLSRVTRRLDRTNRPSHAA